MGRIQTPEPNHAAPRGPDHQTPTSSVTHSALGGADLWLETEPWLLPDDVYCAAGFQILEEGKEGGMDWERGRGPAGLKERPGPQTHMHSLSSS